MSDLEALLARLIAHQVKFVIIGGYAAAAHGARLVTHDLDVCCDFTAGNLMRLQDAVCDLHPAHRMHPARPPLRLTPETCRGWRNLYLQTDLGQLDCLDSVAGVGDFAEAERNSVEIGLPLGRCRLLSLDALIQAKEAMSGPKDQLALVELKAIREQLSDE